MSKGLSRDRHDQHRIVAKVDERWPFATAWKPSSPPPKPNPAASSNPSSTKPSTEDSDMAAISQYFCFLLSTFSPINPSLNRV